MRQLAFKSYKSDICTFVKSLIINRPLWDFDCHLKYHIYLDIYQGKRVL